MPMPQVITKHGLKLVPTKGMSRTEWLAERMNGIGGSDMSSILGLNHRFSAIELFYQKVGLTFQSEEENEAMFWGTRGETNVLDIGQYYDIDTASYIDNHESGRKLRKITKLGYMVTNPDYPWIISNIDGAVNFTPRNFMMDGPAEAKTISRQTAEMWADKIPPYHLAQINTYMIGCGPMMRKQEAYIFYLEDGRTFRGFCIPVIEPLRDAILERSEEFWKRVLKGREIMADIKDNDMRLRYLAEIEPEPDNSEAYYKFLSELFQLKSSFVRVDATKDDVVNALMYKKYSKDIKDLSEQRQEHKNQIIKSLHDAGANVIDFADGGKITFNKKLYVNIKTDILNEILEENQ